MTAPAGTTTPPATPDATAPGPGADARGLAPGVTDVPGTIMPVSDTGKD